MVNGALNVSQNPFKGSEMGFPWIMHVKTDLMNDISYVWTSECEYTEEPRQDADRESDQKQVYQRDPTL